MIEIKDLTKSFDGVEVLSHISMTLESGLRTCWSKWFRKNNVDEAYLGFCVAHIGNHHN